MGTKESDRKRTEYKFLFSPEWVDEDITCIYDQIEGHKEYLINKLNNLNKQKSEIEYCKHCSEETFKEIIKHENYLKKEISNLNIKSSNLFKLASEIYQDTIKVDPFEEKNHYSLQQERECKCFHWKKY